MFDGLFGYSKMRMIVYILIHFRIVTIVCQNIIMSVAILKPNLYAGIFKYIGYLNV